MIVMNQHIERIYHSIEIIIKDKIQLWKICSIMENYTI